MRFALILAWLLLHPGVLSAQGTRRAETDIRARVAELETAWNRRDAAAISALYTADGDFMAMDAPIVTGRAALLAAGVRDLAALSPTKRISITPTSIRFLRPDVALVNAVAQFNEGLVREDRGTYVLVRTKGTWRIAALRVLPPERR